MKVKASMLDFSSLSVMIETTRWCNQECNHCLRGTRQRRKQKMEQVKNFLSNSNQWSTIMFSGGDPSLAPEIIEETLNYSENCDITYGSFWLATNGLVATNKFFDAITHWAEYMNRVGELCGIKVSTDRWHLNSLSNKWKFDELEETITNQIFSSFYIERSGPDWSNLIAEGRAESMGVKEIENSLCLLVDITKEGDVYYELEGELYLTVKGDILTSCDLSFEHADQRSPFYLCRHDDNLLEKMVEHFNLYPDKVKIWDHREDQDIPAEQYLLDHEPEDIYV